MAQKILLITPPLTQMNTPYPGTAYLTYFLKRRGFDLRQADLGLELILRVFSRQGLRGLFAEVRSYEDELNEAAERILALEEDYVSCVDAVIRFLQNSDMTLGHRFCTRRFLPEGPRFATLEEMDVNLFGTMAVEDKARFLATLFLEDLADFIRENVDSGFGFSRYQEKIAVAASSFDDLQSALEEPSSYFDLILCELLQAHFDDFTPDLCGFSVPFPGNLYGALKCADYVKEHYPQCAVMMGGGYPNTELRELSDPRVFDYLDYITLDDGERPLMQLLAYMAGEIVLEDLQRTFLRNDEGKVQYINGCTEPDFPHTETGVPDYSGLLLDKYLSIIEIANPMHRLWNDGRWNKMTIAHGCYWKRCSFCDVTLDYIERYDEAPAKILVDRMEELIEETGQSGFHFVDEAAPPAVLQELALEVLSRRLVVSWWTNIRFERAFTADLCRLLSAAGCIAVSGGLEVASDRLLLKMKKGTNLTQVTQSTKAFTDAGILVHAYLMYGFPTETEQETIDALDVVRQLFENKLIHSGFWHRFAMTVHSPIGKNPREYGVAASGPEYLGFARNELTHEDPDGCNHDDFSAGLRKSLFNYMHGVGLEQPLTFWFDHEIPPNSNHPQLISRKIARYCKAPKKLATDRVLWLGGKAQVFDTESGAGCDLVLSNSQEDFVLEVDAALAEWLENLLSQLIPGATAISFQEVKDYFNQYFGDSFEDLLDSEIWQTLGAAGLLVLRK